MPGQEETTMNLGKGLSLPLVSLGLAVASAQPAAGSPAQAGAGPELGYFGRATVKVRTAEGFVIYIDPYAPGDYSEPADLILVTHGHGDHNEVRLIARKPGTVILAPEGAVSERGARTISEGGTFDAGPVKVRALPAENRNHSRNECVGYLLSFDGIVLYHSGDTNWLPEMETWSRYHIDWALLCCDGFYNMPPAEASRCAAAMKAAHVIPIHSSKSGLFDEKNARAVTAPSLVVLRPGEKTPLKP